MSKETSLIPREINFCPSTEMIAWVIWGTIGKNWKCMGCMDIIPEKDIDPQVVAEKDSFIARNSQQERGL